MRGGISMGNSFKIWDKLPIIQEIPLVFRYIDPLERYPMHNIGRSHHGLLYSLEGRETYILENSTIQTEPGNVIYLPKSAHYYVEMSDPCCVALCIDFETSAPMNSPAFQLTPLNNRLIKSFFTEMEHIWQIKHIGWEAECMSLLYRIMAELEKQAQQRYYPSSTQKRIQPSVDYLHEHFQDSSLRVEILAEQSGFHPRYFAKIFKDIYGVSPKQYLTQLRMERARELILSNRYTISQVAQMTGFMEIYHFSKTLKHEHGISPSDYSKNKENSLI